MKSSQSGFWSFTLVMMLLAILVIPCIGGTGVESRLATGVAQARVCDGLWLGAWLVLLCMNLLCMVLVRYPLKSDMTRPLSRLLDRASVLRHPNGLLPCRKNVSIILMHKKLSLFYFILSVVGLVFFAGCSKEEIKVYRVDKEAAPSVSPMGNEIPPPEVAEHLEWTTPSGWEQKAPSSMRYGSFAISGKNGAQADLSVISLAGEAGGVLANINRWRDQLGLSPITEGQLSDNFTQVEVLDTKVVLVDFANSNPSDGKVKTRMLAAILPHGPSTWFFKMTGDDSLVEAQKTRFTQFLKSLRFTGAFPSPMMGAGDSMPSLSRPSGTQALSWKLPAGWKEMEASGMRKGSFLVSGKQGMQADVSIISLPGNAGGFLPNVNRWRGQISLPPLTEEEFSKFAAYFDVRGEQALLVDMLSQSVLEKKTSRTRVIGSILVKEGQCWFFKMMGDDALVESQKEAFTNFVKSVEIPGA